MDEFKEIKDMVEMSYLRAQEDLQKSIYPTHLGLADKLPQVLDRVIGCGMVPGQVPKILSKCLVLSQDSNLHIEFLIHDMVQKWEHSSYGYLIVLW